MTSYAAIYRSETAQGSDSIEGVVITDGDSVRYLQPPQGSDLIRGLSEDAEVDLPGDPESVLRILLRGLSYYEIAGPYTFDADLQSSTDAVAKIYDLRPV